MTTVADLERLEALVARLAPLAQRQRGELITADDWNTLVGALIEIGRAAVTAGQPDEVAAHEHNDQVAIGWLDPRLRTLITGGGVKDPAVQTEFIKIRRDLTQLVGRVDRVGTDLDSSRSRIDEFATRDLVREATLTRLDRKVLGAAEGRGDIADLRGTLRTLQNEVGRAVEVGTRLEANGQPIDIPGLVERVGAVEALRDRLTQPNGELLDAGALEVRLLELQGSVVSPEDLKQAIEQVRGDIRPGGPDLDALLDSARLAGRGAAVGAVETLGSELRSSVTARFADLGPAIAAEVAQATGTLGDDLREATRQQLEAAIKDQDTSVRADLTGMVEDRFGATTRLVEERLERVSDLVSTQVGQAVESGLANALRRVDRQLEEVRTGISDLDERLRRNGIDIEQANGRFEVARREDATARARMRTELADQITALRGEIGPQIRTEVDNTRTILKTDLEASTAANRRDLEVVLAQVARNAAATEIQVLSTSIRTDLQSLLRQEVGNSLAAVRNDLAVEIGGLQQRVAGLVSNEVARAAADIPRLVTAEIETFRPEIVRIVDTRVNRRPIG